MNTGIAIITFIIFLLQLLIYVIVAQAILSWLVAFNVINTQNRFVYSLLVGLDRITGPIMRPIRNRLPDFGGIDFSPLVVILLILLAQRLLHGLQMDLLV